MSTIWPSRKATPESRFWTAPTTIGQQILQCLKNVDKRQLLQMIAKILSESFRSTREQGIYWFVGLMLTSRDAGYSIQKQGKQKGNSVEQGCLL